MSHTSHIILVEFSAVDQSFVVDWPVRGPIFDQAIFGDPSTTGGVTLPTPVPFTFSNRSWVSQPADSTLPNTWYDPRLLTPYRIERSLPLLPEATRRSQQQIANLDFNNADRAYDTILVTYRPEGQDLTIKRGHETENYQNFDVIYSGVVRGWSTTRSKVSISLQDLTFKLSAQVQTPFGGTGGLDGTPEAFGKLYPECYGQCNNITPVNIDSTNRVYMVNWRRVQSIGPVYDGGFPLTFSADYPTYEALLAATIAPGFYATCLLKGIFRLQSLPSLLITCDVYGDMNESGVYVNTIGGILKRIFTDRLFLAATDYDDASFATLGTGVSGWYLAPDASPATGEAVTDQILTACGLGWYGSTRDRRIKIQTVPLPDGATPSFYYNKQDIITFQRLEAPTPPRYRQDVAYARNWTPQSDTDLAAGLTDAQRSYQIRPYFQSAQSFSDVVLKNRVWIAGGLITSPFANLTDAFALATTILSLHGVQRNLFQVALKIGEELLELAMIVNISYDRYGLSGGKNFVIIAMVEDAAQDRVTLTVWG
jgi:hypothetical protein